MFLSEIQIAQMGFKHIGKNVLISSLASIYGAENISIGDNVRIDDFCIISAGIGGIELGNNIHIACYSSIRGASKVTFEDHTNLAAYSSILSSNDDYSGKHLIGPCQPCECRFIDSREVIVKKYSIIGERCAVLPGVTIHENSVIGIGSLVKSDIPTNEIWAGIPCKKIKDRNKLLNA